MHLQDILAESVLVDGDTCQSELLTLWYKKGSSLPAHANTADVSHAHSRAVVHGF